MHIRFGTACLALALGGCGSKDNVALSGSISDVAISLEQLALGTRLSGGFRLELELGAQAPATANVTLGSFSLIGPGENEVERLMVLDPTGAFPMVLEPGQRRSAGLTLDDADPIAAPLDGLCESPRVAGVVNDEAANGRATMVSSSSFIPQGC